MIGTAFLDLLFTLKFKRYTLLISFDVQNIYKEISMNVKEMCQMALFTALIAAGAFIKLPISIVPVTLQTLFVILAGLMLKPKMAIGSVLLYIGLGLIGLPIFANGGGIGYVFQPSFGYLIGFAFAAGMVSVLSKNVQSMLQTLLLCIVANFVIYIIGLAYFHMIEVLVYQTSFTLSWMMVNLFLVYLPGDLISIVVAIKAADVLKKAMPAIAI
jgi:biotin transport system substrate-specific component